MKLVRQRVIRPPEFLWGGFGLFALKAHQMCLRLRFAVPEHMPPLLIDTHTLIRVLHLLVDRAIAVTPVGGVTVHVQWTTGRLVVVVEDEGPWIAPRNIPGLFAISSPDTALQLAARLTQQAYGVLTATSEGRRAGLCVTFEVPALVQPS